MTTAELTRWIDDAIAEWEATQPGPGLARYLAERLPGRGTTERARRRLG